MLTQVLMSNWYSKCKHILLLALENSFSTLSRESCSEKLVFLCQALLFQGSTEEDLSHRFSKPPHPLDFISGESSDLITSP